MSTGEIQAAVDSVASQQVSNQFGTQCYALLFRPGTYGSGTDPLNFQVGYYTGVAGLGQSPNDVVINGSVYVRNQCDGGFCTALNNFWRSLSNLTINVTTLDFGCYTGEFWAVSQAAPMRRVHVNGFTTLMDYCTGPSFASGGFIAIQRSTAAPWSTARASGGWSGTRSLDGWTNGVWDPSVLGVVGAPPQCFPRSRRVAAAPYTTLATSPVTREAPYLYTDAAGSYNVIVPGGAARLRGHDMGQPADSRHFDPHRGLLHRQADGRRPGDPHPALSNGQNVLLPRRLSSTGRSRSSARARSCWVSASDARADQRRSDDDGRRRYGREARRADARRRPGELAGPAPGWHRERAQERPRRPDDAQRRVLPHRRGDRARPRRASS
jgi:hypothetical protein